MRVNRLVQLAALLTVIVFVFTNTSPQYIEAADVSVSTNVFSVLGSVNVVTGHPGAPSLVCISDSICYAFFINSSGGIAYASSTNGGATWGNTLRVTSQTSAAVNLGVWWSGWTYPATSTQYIHVVHTDTTLDDTYYTRFDTSNNSTSTSVVATSQNTTTCGAGADCTPAITMTSNGDLIIANAESTDRWVVKCAATSTCTTASNWFELANGFYGSNGDDVVLLAPIGGTNNTMLVWQDSSLNNVYYNVYSATTSSWKYSGTASGTVDTNIEENVTYEAQLIGISVDPDTGAIGLTYADDTNDYTISDHDVKFKRFTDSTGWVSGTNPATDVTGAITATKLSFDTQNNVWYSIYARQSATTSSTTLNLYYRTSSDDGSTWSAESSAINDVQGEMVRISNNIASNERLGVVWAAVPPSTFGLYYENVVDIATPVYSITGEDIMYF